MAHAGGTSARAHRLIAFAAVLLLAVATALAFARVFLGSSTTLKLVAVAVAAALIAVALERRSLLLATVVSAIGLALAIGLFVFPDTTWYGLPTMDTLRAAGDAAALVGEQARIQAAPAEPIPPLLLAAVVSLWAAVFSAHALAFRAGSPLLGLIPPVALVAFSDSVLEQFVKPLYGVLFLAAALLVVFADGLARVQGWGPVWSSARRGVASFAGRRARGLALTALGAATLAPIFIPGFGSRALIDLGSGSQDTISIDPFVSIQAELTDRKQVEVLRVTADRPTYIRLFALPRFDGVSFRLAEPRAEGIVVSEDGAVPLPFESEDVSGLTQPVDIEVVRPSAQEWLPVPYPVTRIDVPGRTVRFDRTTASTYLDRPLERGDTYHVTAQTVMPTADQLRAVQDNTAPLDGGAYTALPPEMPDRIHEIAVELTADQDNRFDRVKAIEGYLRDTSIFSYDPRTELSGGTNSILQFLEETRAGFCQQFSFTMAVLLRELEIDSRIVVGFSAGTLGSPGGPYSVMSDQAHSWVEVYFEGYGWLPFEPTPTRNNPNAQYVESDVVCGGPECGDGGLPFDPSTGSREGGFGQVPDRVDTDPRLVPRTDPGPLGSLAPVDDEPFVTAPRVLLAAAIAGALFLLLVPPIRALRRRSRLRKAAHEPRRLILVTYEQFVERATGLGLGRAPGQTFEEYRRKVAGTGYLSDGHLDRLTRLATSAAYSPHEPDAEQAAEAGDAADVAIKEIRQAVGPSRWFVALYRRR
jgi:transglutaminase-like putative cysteine protease